MSSQRSSWSHIFSRAALGIVSAAALVSAATPVASAATFTGKDLFEWCGSDPRSTGDVYCTLYVSGFVHGVQSGVGYSKTALICLPRHFTPVEARALYLRTIRTLEGTPAHALFMADRFDVALAAVLAREFRCPEMKSAPE